MSCTYEEFQRFDAFFSKFMSIAREYFLPPQRQRFGLVSERSMLSSLGFEDSDSWSVMLNFNGCPNCSKILKEDDDLKTYLRMHHPLVMELDGDGNDLEPALPSNVPSIILFVDRLSASSNIRSKSKEALDAFKELSLQNKFSNQMDGTNIGKPKFSLLQPSQSSRNKRVSYPSVHPRRKYTPKAQMVKLKDKMNVMIINDGGNVALSNIAADAQGNSVHDILEYLLQQKKEEKLSSLAKEVGFQLLSDDFAVGVADKLQPQLENIPSDQIPSELPVEGTVESSVNLGNDQSPNTGNLSAVTHVGQSGLNVERTGQNDNEEIMYYEENTSTEPGHVIITDELGTADVMDKEQLLNTTSTSAVKHEEQTRCNDVESSFRYGKQEIICSEKTNTIEQSQMIMNDELGTDGNTKVDEKSSMEVDKLLEQQVHYQGFTGPFFFSDGGYQLLRSLTTGSKIPSVVIVDPISQKHYIYGKKEVSYSSLLEFLDGFLNGTLISYQRSESVLFSTREAVRPPFVNLDFHEVESIPRVTVNTFSELVLGVNQSETQNFGLAWKKDVFVLFSNSWCGFCQRMELVVREVYRAFKGYMNISKSESWHSGSVFMNDNLGNVILTELPPIFLMDCTLNDCSSILNRLDQREFYPALILFPAERKIPISYEGDMTVTNVMKFIANRGSKSHHHGERSGILLLESEKGGRKQTSSENASPIAVQEEASFVNEKYHDALLNNRATTAAVIDYKIKSRTSNELHESSANVVVGSILTATDKLLHAFPFDKSTILIVKADRVTGFQGLIINKHIKWDALREFEDGLEFIKQAPLSFGGPVIAHGTPLMSLVQRVVREEYPEVLPGVYFVDQISTIQEIEHLKSGNQSTIDYWFFLGYSSWLWDQLYDEIAEGAWLVSEEIGKNFAWPRS